MTEIKAIPEPPGWPILGHAFGVIDNEFPITSFESLAEEHGEHQLSLFLHGQELNVGLRRNLQAQAYWDPGHLLFRPQAH